MRLSVSFIFLARAGMISALPTKVKVDQGQSKAVGVVGNSFEEVEVIYTIGNNCTVLNEVGVAFTLWLWEPCFCDFYSSLYCDSSNLVKEVIGAGNDEFSKPVRAYKCRAIEEAPPVNPPSETEPIATFQASSPYAPASSGSSWLIETIPLLSTELLGPPSPKSTVNPPSLNTQLRSDGPADATVTLNSGVTSNTDMPTTENLVATITPSSVIATIDVTFMFENFDAVPTVTPSME